VPKNVLQGMVSAVDKPKTMQRILSLASVVGLSFLAVHPTQADLFATSPQGGSASVSITRTLGTPFAFSNATAIVTSLGFFDSNGDGLSEAHQVGIFGPDRSLLGMVTIQSGTASTLHDGVRWAALASPITLAANTEYMLATTIQEGGDLINGCNPWQVTPASGFALTQAGYTEGFDGSNLVYPEFPTSQMFYGFGANFEMTRVPEPGTMTLLAVGLVRLYAITGSDQPRQIT